MILKKTRLAALLLALIAASPAVAGDISLSAAWIRWLPGDLPLAGYFKLHNGSDHAVVLKSAAAPDFTSAELHESVEKDGEDRMVHVDSVKIAPGRTLAFAPGGYHVMLMHRKHPVHPGQILPITLKLAGGRSLHAAFRVKSATGQ